MKRKFFIALIFILPLLANAQTIDRSKIVGTWTATGGQITSNDLPPNVQQLMNIMIDGFKDSIWSFDENGTFRLKFKPNSSPIMQELKVLENSSWKYEETTNQIEIGSNLLVMTIKQTESGIAGYFSDTPIYLNLEKQ